MDDVLCQKKTCNREKEQKFVREENKKSVNLTKRIPAFWIVCSVPVTHPFVIIVTTLIVSPTKTNQNNRKPVFCLKVGQLQKKKIEQVRGGGTKWYCCCWKNLRVLFLPAVSASWWIVVYPKRKMNDLPKKWANHEKIEKQKRGIIGGIVPELSYSIQPLKFCNILHAYHAESVWDAYTANVIIRSLSVLYKQIFWEPVFPVPFRWNSL